MQKYVLYIGLNDKITKKQEIETKVAIDIVTKTLAKQGITDLTLQQRKRYLYSHRRHKNK